MGFESDTGQIEEGQAMTRPKTKKEENPLVLGAEVGLFRGGHGVTKAGKIVRVHSKLLGVEWEEEQGKLEYFGRNGQSFFGSVDEKGQIVETANVRRGESPWGGEDDPHLTILTSYHREKIDTNRIAKQQRLEEQRKQEEERKANPVYVKRQQDMERYRAALAGLSANIEDSWNNRSNFRIELDNIPSEQMDELIEAIRRVRK